MLPLVMPGLAAIDRDNRVSAFDPGNFFLRFGEIFLRTFDNKIVAQNAISCNSKR